LINGKVLTIYFVFAFSIWVIVIISMNYYIGNPVLPEKIEKNLETTYILDIERKKLFDTMADLKNYPTIFPNNVLLVNIINQSENIIFAEEKLSEAGITTKIIVKHTIFPYEKHIVTIMDGDAQNTTIITTFEDFNSSTKLNVKTNMSLKGILIPFGLLPQNNLENVIDTIIFGFEDYAKNL